MLSRAGLPVNPGPGHAAARRLEQRSGAQGCLGTGTSGLSQVPSKAALPGFRGGSLGPQQQAGAFLGLCLALWPLLPVPHPYMAHLCPTNWGPSTVLGFQPAPRSSGSSGRPNPSPYTSGHPAAADP